MEKRFDISKYVDYFHDGCLFNILKKKDAVAFKISSSEVDPLDIEKDVILSKDHRIRGVLHLENIQNISLTGGYQLENLFDMFNLGTILDFEIQNEVVEFGILWENAPPKPRTNEFTTIIIKASRIWWENIPEMS